MANLVMDVIKNYCKHYFNGTHLKYDNKFFTHFKLENIKSCLLIMAINY